MDRADGHHSSLLTKLGLGALTANSAIAIYMSWGDPATVAFVTLAFTALLLLFHFLRRFERAQPEDRGRLKVAVWGLSTVLTVMFAARVAPLMPPVVGVTVWVMAIATAAGGFWAFFVNP